MQAAPELLQLGDRVREPALRLLERCRSVARTGKPRALELGGETAEPQLSPLAEAPFEAPPLRISRDE
jgi:hypothetical protein